MADLIESKSSYRHGKGRPCTDSYIRPLITSLCRQNGSKRILDIGCGNGSLCRDLVDSGFKVVGMEPSRSGVALARELVPEGVFYEKGVYDAPSEMAETDFDTVVSTEVIEHLFRPAALLEFASMKLSVGGMLILSTPYHGYLKNLAIALLNHWDSHHSPEWDGGHIKFWSRRSLTKLLESNGFRVVEFHGVGRLSWLWMSMILVARKKDKA